MRSPTSRATKAVTLIASPVAILAAAGLIWHASYAAFSGETRNSGNAWPTGTVALTDDDAGAARFQVSNMVPGQTDTKCIKVTANATVAGLVKGYAINPVTSPQGLENHILVTVSEGTGGSFASCTGYTASNTLASGVPLSTLMLANSYATGLGDWTVTGDVHDGEFRTFRFTWTFDTTGMTQAQLDNLQGAHAGADLEWELQTT